MCTKEAEVGKRGHLAAAIAVTMQESASTAQNHGSVFLKMPPSEPASPAAAAPMAIDWGQIILPIPAPITLAAARTSGDTAMADAASA